MDKLVNNLLDGSLSRPLHDCVLTQCGTQTPIVYTGHGLIEQSRDLKIQLRIFAEAVETVEALTRQFDRPFTPGILVPESAYFDFEGYDINGQKWAAERLTINPDFGASTYIQIEPWQLTTTCERGQAASSPHINAFAPLQIELPWHAVTQFGDLGWKRDKFSHNTTSHEWSVRKNELGTWIHFSSKTGSIEDDFENFIRALSILCGTNISPIVTEQNIDLTRTTNITNIEKEDASLLPPLNHKLAEHGDAHEFLAKFLTSKTCPQHLALIHRMWHRILRARENDIENSSLVLSVAIEGLLMKAISNSDDEDAEFKAEINSVMPIIKAANLPTRVLQSINSSFGHAVKQKPKSTLQRLIKQHIIEDAHLKTWEKMRHLSAHGQVLDWKNEKIQNHLQRFHTCLDLFYRLTFFLIGYSGRHRNYSTAGWPTMHFPNPEKLNVSTASPTSTDSWRTPNL